ncbi:ATP-dependent helicase wrn-1-like [Diadema antillarum]|uniref:ATP-dependent helicase wrn-1-like n=1 Tax=Diadema antillarum TaxID=105358 RepID=UPI003A8976C5
MDNQSCIRKVATEMFGESFVLKTKQVEIIDSLAGGSHTLAILPTAYGKSIPYVLFGPLMDKLNPETRHMTLVVSPLKSLMMDQMRRWESHGIRTAAILGHSGMDMDRLTENDLMNGERDLIFTSPEAIMSPKWWKWVRKFQERICLLVLDEVHCLTKWGLTFREEYLRVHTLRSRLTCPVLMLSATCTDRMVTAVCENLSLRREEVKIVALSPDRPNIHLEIARVPNKQEALGWYIEELKQKGTRARKTIIYARHIDHVSELYLWINESLQKDGHSTGSEQPCTVHNRLSEMFHASTDIDSQERISMNFSSKGSTLRCVIATIAFGLGVDVPDVDTVIHWGPPSDVLSYWQETGRCGRDGRRGRAIMYLPPGSVNKRWLDDEMSDILKLSCCIRQSVLKALFVPGMEQTREQVGPCCSVCDTVNH